MQFPLPQGEVTFDVIHNDGWIRVCITDGVATFFVDNIWDDEVVVRAFNKAAGLGAFQGTMFTDEVVNDQMAEMHTMRSEKGVTWLGGKVTRLDDGKEGPRFRIDWETIPTITV